MLKPADQEFTSASSRLMISRRGFLQGLALSGVAAACAGRRAWADAADFIGQGERLPTIEQIRAGSPDFWKLADLINDYRAGKRLHRIPLSPKLTAVAALHARDLHENAPHEEYGSLHSWSLSDRWRGGAFKRDDESTFKVMWDKPKELFGYGGLGFEVTVKGARDVAHALVTLQASKLHDDVLMNRGLWADERWSWKALGAVYYKGFACAWFGDHADA
jgi:hypothetical protein